MRRSNANLIGMQSRLSFVRVPFRNLQNPQKQTLICLVIGIIATVIESCSRVTKVKNNMIYLSLL